MEYGVRAKQVRVGRKRKGGAGREKMKKIQEREVQIAEQVYILMKELGLEHFPAKADFYRTGRTWLYGRVCRSGGIVAWARKLRLPTALEARGREPGNNPRNKRPTLCWRCANAVPNPPKGRGCEWSMFFRPVPGWSIAMHSLPNIGKAPSVYQCPKYREG